MKYLRQLFRQPLKTVTGVILVTLAVAILCVSVGQAFAVRMTEQNLFHQFTTVAMFTGTYTVQEDALSWLKTTAEEHPDVIKMISEQGFLSANIPELTPLNYTDPEDGNFIDTSQTGPTTVRPWPHGRPYSSAMFVITLDRIGGINEKSRTYFTSEELSLDDFATIEEYAEWMEENYKPQKINYAYTMELVGTITEVISLQEGYADPTGRTVTLTFSAPDARDKALKALSKLKKGEQYIVYGMDYRDKDWELRNMIKNGVSECVLEIDGELMSETIDLDGFDMSKMHILTAEEKAEFTAEYEEKFRGTSTLPIGVRFTAPHARYDMDDKTSVYLSQSQYKLANAATLTLGNPISQLNYEFVRDYEGGPVKEVRYITEYTYFDGEDYVNCTAEEYAEVYSIPTIAKLDGSAEEFLNSAEGAEWKAAMERDAVNNNAFLTVGVDHLGYLIDFVREDSIITSGRAFTAEELENGSRICIIHEALAAENGLEVGDTVTMNFYHTDKVLPYDKKPTGWGEYLVPNAAFYYDTTPITETVEYTVVGLWRGELLWPDVNENEYSFSPNTIFIPNDSTETEMEHTESILYTTPVIQNGKLEEFRHLAEEAGYHGLFTYFDRGYSMLMKNFFNYENMALQVLAIGCTIYSVIILLYLMLYPGSYSRKVRTMESLGVPYIKRVLFVLKSSMSIVTFASILGILLGSSLWGMAVAFLQSSANAATSLFVEPGTLGFIVLAQFGFVLILTIFVSLYVAVPKKMSARR